MKKISVVSSCYNEEGCLEAFYTRIVETFRQLPDYSYEIIVADNCSADRSRDVLREIASKDPQFKVILNAGNFGHMMPNDDIVIGIVFDQKDPQFPAWPVCWNLHHAHCLH